MNEKQYFLSQPPVLSTGRRMLCLTNASVKTSYKPGLEQHPKQRERASGKFDGLMRRLIFVSGG
jgi:hypothetical protein